MLSLCFVLALLSVITCATPTIHQPSVEQRQSSSPCGDLAKARNAWLTDNPDTWLPSIPVEATLVYDCLTSVPIQKDFSVQLVKNVRAWFEFGSDIDYIANPPSGSVWRPLDLFELLDDIAEYLDHDKYNSQYDFEVDLYTFGLHFHDYHSYVLPGLFRTGGWDRNFTLVTYSTDGLEMPKVYLAQDAVTVTELGTYELATKNTQISPVATINGIPVQEFLQTQALEVMSHDPDAMYNQLFSSIPLTFNPAGTSIDYFQTPYFYPGPKTVVELEDGTVLSFPVLSSTACYFDEVATGTEFWQKCVFERDEELPNTNVSASATAESATSTATATSKQHARAETTTGTGADPRLRGHPRPERIDIDDLLSGYFLEGYEDVAVLVIRGFAGISPGYLDSFQNTLESFLKHAKDKDKTRLIIDLSGNGGGYIDASTELLAQLFPNGPLDQKHNMRASLGLQAILDLEGQAVDEENQNATSEEVLVSEAERVYAWQSMMTPEATEFVSFDDFYGPSDFREKGNYTHFFQGNYTNRDPSELDQEGIQITGYGDRLRASDTQPPFDASNMVILTDGACGSACPIVVEMLLNTHGVPSIVVGGRPSTGPMQTSGSTKGSVLWGNEFLTSFLNMWGHVLDSPDVSAQLVSTPFEHLEAFGLLHGHISLNGRNNYRMGDDTETPLQMVYSAADCRIWPTPDMLVNQSHVWSRVADIAFASTRKEFGAGGGPYTSEYCVKDSTDHSTSVTGGLKYGELGNQNPPRRTYAQYTGWLKDGKTIVQGLSPVRIDEDDLGNSAVAGSSLPTNGQVKVGLSDMKMACDGYTGSKWLLTLLCAMFG